MVDGLGFELVKGKLELPFQGFRLQRSRQVKGRPPIGAAAQIDTHGGRRELKLKIDVLQMNRRRDNSGGAANPAPDGNRCIRQDGGHLAQELLKVMRQGFGRNRR